jgi:hypothetical protein
MWRGRAERKNEMIVEVSEKIGQLKIEPYEKFVRLNMGDFFLSSYLKKHRGQKEKRQGSVFFVYSVVTPENAPQVTLQVTPQVERLIATVEREMTRWELMDALLLKDRMHFTRDYLQPALETGLLEMTIPDKPRSSNQRYRLTDKGRRLQEKL